MTETRPVALIAGAGGVLGTALTVAFSEAGYDVIGLRRSAQSHAPEAPSRTIACNLADPKETRTAAERSIAASGRIDVAVFNAAHLVIKPFLELNDSDVETALGAGIHSAVSFAHAVLPTMLGQGRGTVVFSGATASTRGSSGFAALAAAKFALRGLSQSLAREFQPHGIHVCHVVLDGLLRDSPSVRLFGGDNENTLCPRAVAQTYLWLTRQPEAAWTQELDLRPRAGRF